MYEGLTTEECVGIVCYNDLGKCEEDKEGACVCWLFFITFPCLFFFCALVSELLFYFLCVELYICKNTATEELLQVLSNSVSQKRMDFQYLGNADKYYHPHFKV